MSWLNAHETYVMEIMARDHADELRSASEAATQTERTSAPTDVLADARPRAAAALGLFPPALTKVSR